MSVLLSKAPYLLCSSGHHWSTSVLQNNQKQLGIYRERILLYCMFDAQAFYTKNDCCGNSFGHDYDFSSFGFYMNVQSCWKYVSSSAGAKLVPLISLILARQFLVITDPLETFYNKCLPLCYLSISFDHLRSTLSQPIVIRWKRV